MIVEWVLIMTLATTDGAKVKAVYPTKFPTASKCHDEIKHQFFDPQSEFNQLMMPEVDAKKFKYAGMHCEKWESSE